MDAIGIGIEKVVEILGQVHELGTEIQKKIEIEIGTETGTETEIDATGEFGTAPVNMTEIAVEVGSGTGGVGVVVLGGDLEADRTHGPAIVGSDVQPD